ncbi:hypothetical protein FRB90_002284 [Tulasnella sp. 427]|nr:hypothetical protein FRB90_002284 [Tulasnella sp. 427]
MNGDVLEELVLSGALFNGKGDDSPPRRGGVLGDSPSSSRSGSPDPFPVPAEHGSNDERTSYVGNRPSTSAATAEEATQESIGLGPGRTGVKGVIRDRAEARERDLEKIQREMEDLAGRQKKMDFSAPTYFEELDRDKEGGKESREGDAWGGIEEWRKRRLVELKAGAGAGASSAGGGPLFGHLREVGVGGFVEAVEKVSKDVWVVVHIYDGSLGRCTILDSHLSSLARTYPRVKFLRARAGAIGFATSSTGASTSTSGGFSSTFRRNPGPTRTTTTSKTRYRDPEDSDSSGENTKGFVGAYQEVDEDEEEGEDEDEPEPDYDVLPTMLVYHAGELAHSWPRVDFDIAAAVGKGGGVGFKGGLQVEVKDVEAFLVKHNIIHPSSAARAGGGRDSSDEDEDIGKLEFASDVE